MLQKIKQDLKNDLIAGLVVVIPLATTIWLAITISAWVVRLLTRFPKQLTPFDGLNPFLLDLINLLIGLSVPLLAILIIGLMARNIAGRWLLDVGEKVVQSIPLAGSVYKTLQQLLQTVFQDSSTRFRRAVLVEYPRRGIWAVAFVTGAMTATATATPQMLSIFVPTTPNPTSGWYAIVPESDVVNLSISIEDAFKLILSGGIVGPNLAAAVPSDRVVSIANEGQSTAPMALDRGISELTPDLADYPQQLSVLPVDEDC
ncbi:MULTISPECIES: DUF502 domain-containing protein [Cyanophyceae]|uniref:DUF502 domain-containing protein n=1 Tax=Cyanophyceae TaxID=3028117 RepID=UPI001686D2EB|nr:MULTISPECIES: DUF502 domain-containing protein [unclassified Phormidium]MBD1918759.1 DUF502 domain-containing protein [Phormidium sp. FACHB-77]MBD2033412.1 DUF502 domain-containing protein [Phormidium sp. FACHB-322]MBD2053911.1 DUF502 domain-containing protein [Leptolyngbya sp. FACHB-60]